MEIFSVYNFVALGILEEVMCWNLDSEIHLNTYLLIIIRPSAMLGSQLMRELS